MPERPEAIVSWLERRHPKRWRRRDLTEIAVADRAEGPDEQGLLGEEASRAMHDALRIAAAESRGELPPAPADVIEGTATEAERPAGGAS
jgi:hypothetical protein